MTPGVTGALLGLTGAAGLLIALAAAPPLRRPRLEQRLAPYLRDAPAPSRLLATGDLVLSHLGVVIRLFGPFLGDAVRALDRAVGGARSVRRRLAALGGRQRLEDFRVEQVVWGALGLLAGVLIAAVYTLALQRVEILSAVLLSAGGLVGGVLACDWWLSARVRRREEAMLAEFPVVAELLALAVGAGEGPVAAIERVCRLSHGELAAELQATLAEARAGAPLVQALQSLSQRTTLDPLSRFVDGVIIAIERGTPLADVLRSQAGDVRAAGKRGLLESGGRREIAMMVPVVFLVLPVTVVFALYPGLISIVRLTQ
ncbi:MAG: type II secretion system F family protein [Actinomycetota bacterium]|nr:type II secretion system F family protein [Actinomycetota bacterium]